MTLSVPDQPHGSESHTLQFVGEGLTEIVGPEPGQRAAQRIGWNLKRCPLIERKWFVLGVGDEDVSVDANIAIDMKEGIAI
jgi:hypothetical protein